MYRNISENTSERTDEKIDLNKYTTLSVLKFIESYDLSHHGFYYLHLKNELKNMLGPDEEYPLVTEPEEIDSKTMRNWRNNKGQPNSVIALRKLWENGIAFPIRYDENFKPLMRLYAGIIFRGYLSPSYQFYLHVKREGGYDRLKSLMPFELRYDEKTNKVYPKEIMRPVGRLLHLMKAPVGRKSKIRIEIPFVMKLKDLLENNMVRDDQIDKIESLLYTFIEEMFVSKLRSVGKKIPGSYRLVLGSSHKKEDAKSLAENITDLLNFTLNPVEFRFRLSPHKMRENGREWLLYVPNITIPKKGISHILKKTKGKMDISYLFE